ncbi:MAG TPA: hypothetical protein VJT49_07690 [Amycolatopsis sp.]|uniref:hypothetical protein n=1 Tax=Amycolatopsis sp. TaxID=37632 RepID=UPI002B467E7B|nr:hypothetical protein [Amycolatopsis sp.]HKS44988.1 hypothetical protein [Amycolatopsis sp.]
MSVIALILSALSLGWQAASYAMTGGRVNVELRVGETDQTGSNLVTTPAGPDLNAADWLQTYANEGRSGRPVIAVRVHPKGRMPVTVERWSLVIMQDNPPQTLFGPLLLLLMPRELSELDIGHGSHGPPFPHRFEAGSHSEMWVVDGELASWFVAPEKERLDRRWLPIAAKVELGDGRTVRTRQRLRV